MTRINTNINSMLAQRVLQQNEMNLSTSLQRLSTGLRINSGKDDPAGLIASQSLKSQEASINAAIGNANRANQVMSTAEGGLQQVNSLLLQLQSLVGQSANDAGLSDSERAANQMQVDSILQTVNRIASATSFQGTKLLNGNFGFTVSAQDSQVLGKEIYGAKLAQGQNRDVQVVVTASAQHAGLFMDTSGALDLSSTDARMVFDVAGALGSREFTFASGTTTSAMANQINTYTQVTGVSAVSTSAGLMLKSTDMGSSQFVSVNIVNTGGQAGSIAQLSATDENAVASGGTPVSFASATNPIQDSGQDVGAIINGVTATADGATATINTDFLNLQLTLGNGAVNASGVTTAVGAQALGSMDAFTITGGGAKFNLGPNVDISNQVSIGLGNISTQNLGSLKNGFLDELASSQDANLQSGDLSKAQKIVNAAINQVSTLRGRIGAFQQNVVQTTINSLGIALQNTTDADSQITDTDFAKATAALTRNQILVQASDSVLKISNSQPRNVLALLQQ